MVAAEKIPRIKTKKVLVLMPPPVDPEEAPINISTIITSNAGAPKSPIGREAKPAVRVETL